MRDARQAINALQNMQQKNFVLLLHVSNQLHSLRKRLVAFGQLLQTLIDIHLTNSISEAGFLSTEISVSGYQKQKAPSFRWGLSNLIWATSYSPTHSRVQYHRG